MANTGSFLLRLVQGDLTTEGALTRLHAVQATCRACNHTSMLKAGAGLTDLRGAGILVCPCCHNRQAVSRMRFEEFVKRLPRADAIDHRAPSLATAPAHHASPQPFLELVVVRAGAALFGIDVESAVEIRGPEALTRGTDGLSRVSVRGQTVPVVDLGLVTGGTRCGARCPAMLLVQAGVQLVALALDEVLTIESVPLGHVHPVSNDGQGLPLCSHRVCLASNQEVALIDPSVALTLQRRLAGSRTDAAIFPGRSDEH